jgi:hypothetical protein
MEEVRWNLLKNERLKRTRGVSFEELIQVKLIAVKEHPHRVHQRMMLFERKGYIWVVPFVSSGDAIFLKTLFPSRKYTQLYKAGRL